MKLLAHCAAGLVVVLSLTALAAGPSIAQIVTYTNRADFDNAVGPTTLETFTDTNHFPIATGILNSQTDLPAINIFPGDIQPGVTYSRPIDFDFSLNIDAGGDFVGGFLDGFVGDPPLTVTFDNPVAGFGFDTNLYMGSEFDVVITSGNSTQLNLAVSDSLNMQFFGFQSLSDGITKVTIKGNGSIFAFALDNFSFGGQGGTTEVPEPGCSALLCGMFLPGAIMLSRRSRA